MVRGWLAAEKTTTAMATLPPDWSKSSIKKLVARLRTPGGETGLVFGRMRSFTAVSSAQVDELKAELPTLPRVSVAVIAKKLGTSSSTAWRVLHNRMEKKPCTNRVFSFQRTYPKVVNTSYFVSGLHLQSCVRFLRFVLIVCHWLHVLTPLLLSWITVFFQKLRSKATRLFVTSLLAPPDGSQLFSEFWSKVSRLSVTSLPVLQLCSVFQGYGFQFGSIDITLDWCATLPSRGEWNFSHRDDWIPQDRHNMLVWSTLFFALSWNLLLEGPNQVKSTKKGRF